MGRKNKRQNSSSHILPETAVQGLPAKDVDADPANGGTPIKNKKDTSELESLFDKLR